MTTPPEFPRPVAVASLADGGVTLRVEANAQERSRLAKRFGLVGIDCLIGEARLTPEQGGVLFRLDGSFTADVVQTCVVTLEALPAHLEDSFARLYSIAAEPGEPVEEDLELNSDEPPDAVTDGHIDVGEAIAEQLALSLDPFPRKPGISFTDFSSPGNGQGPRSDVGTADSGAAEGPFSALAKLKDKLK